MTETLTLPRRSRIRRTSQAIWDDTPYESPYGHASKPTGASLPAGFTVSFEAEYHPDPTTPPQLALRKFLANALRLLKSEGEAKGLTEEQTKLLTVKAFDPCYDAANAIWEQLRSLVSRPLHGQHASGGMTCAWRVFPKARQQVESRPLAELSDVTEVDDVLEPLVYEWTEDSYTVSEAIRNFLAQADATP